MIELPIGLRHALESGECVLFVGSGIGDHLLDPEGKAAPDSASLAKELGEYFSIDAKDADDLAKISEIVELRKGRTELETFLHKRLCNLEPDKTFQWLFSLRWRAIFTTNYDNGIQRAYELSASPPQKPVTITLTSDIVNFDLRFEVPIYHLHGALFAPSKPKILITEEDYIRFREHRKMLFEMLKKEFATSNILYIGYSNRDPNWKTVLAEIASEFYPSKMPVSYRIAPQTDSIESEILKAKNIETIHMSYQDFYENASAALSESKVDPDLLKRIRVDLPSDLLSAFDKNPAAVSRLLSSWSYVNQAPFSDDPNVHSFLRGDQANWALVGSRQHFERDVEEEIYDDLLDYATSSTKTQRVNIILGPAGYGVTTLLMSLAARLAQERAGIMFMLKPGNSVLEGDVEFASSLFPDNPFFFVNNAADHSIILHSLVHRLREKGRSAMFILGERLNEWRQGHGKLRGKEFLIDSLSDSEINRLLDCLAKHCELNKLEPLSRELQFNAIKQKHGKELLVAMREATEGRSFDAILEDEYRGIGDDLSRRLYLSVCCFHQHGAYIRDTLLAQLMEIPLQEMYKATGDATEGVVIYYCIDERKGSYAARSRHRTIAAIVWERCGEPADRDNLVQSSLSALNLNYKADKDAFEYFIRSDRVVNSIRSLEGKIRFFETACKKDPDSPYVRQHYARMLSREDKANLALGQIEEALKMKRSYRVLHHTKGMILKQLALNIESNELARRRLVQSEASFRQGLSMYAKDEYSYQGLSQLYLGWAKRAPTQEEAAEYISKAEEIINEGLKIVPVRYGLWIESSNVQQLLGNEPSRVRALEKAVRDSPGSIVSTYLLGRAYRKVNLPQKTVDVLEPVIKNHHDEFRVFVEYAIALVSLKKPYKEAIAVLRLSTLYGLSDPRFIATLGGILFMDEQFSEANEVFAESSRRDFTATELNTIQFRPPIPDILQEPLRIKGKVMVVKAGYALIESASYPRFLCPGSKFGGIFMEPGLEVTFELAFTAKGPVADRPRINDDTGLS